ncbi:glycoside hydrolase family 16 protein [Dothidotthia symphoricarpi CBS 119687]|uniref:Glycoside hydrolase family 16 protein n=1 Tax=Dothidotthia symphoricarpi CBS 119687 TaxID=1392245 RepID=A0A6A6AJT6_9PLEO|nr:glycoside hydrolase family 16 protein [Dothidotthia symphoricarpi CBS 119687]KAF2131493.1 glycoside hydrolase family 16 protein [Dothidotthia symphoricarpi CBS 119687]
MSLLTLILPVAALLQPALAASAYTTTNNEVPKDNNADCNCYVVQSGAESTTPSYFQYYRFYDFRNLDSAMNESPPLINDTQTAGTLDTWQPEIFNSDAWNTDWSIQNWSKPATDDFPVKMDNSLANVYIGQEDNTSWLALRTARGKDLQTSGEIENNQRNLMHVSMRMYGRVVGDPGAVAGFFTFHDDDNESDIEVLTMDPKDTIRYTNQPSVDKEGNGIEKSSLAPDNLASWNDWQTHRIDWLPKNSYWYLNDKQVAANTYSVPRKQSNLILNMWGDGGEWSGNMTRGHSAEFHIQWIEMTFNTSGSYTGDKVSKRADNGCKTVCKIDGVKQVGTPEIQSAAPDVGVSWGLLVVVGLVSMFVGF